MRVDLFGRLLPVEARLPLVVVIVVVVVTIEVLGASFQNAGWAGTALSRRQLATAQARDDRAASLAELDAALR